MDIFQLGGYVEHPSLYATPSCIFMIGGRAGFCRFHSCSDASSKWEYEHVDIIPSFEEDIALLRHSSQGRCSRPWWGVTGRPWHRLVTSPMSYESSMSITSTLIRYMNLHTAEEKRPLRVLSFEVCRFYNALVYLTMIRNLVELTIPRHADLTLSSEATSSFQESIHRRIFIISQDMVPKYCGCLRMQMK
jgi:hypothetical protein